MRPKQREMGGNRNHELRIPHSWDMLATKDDSTGSGG